MAINGFNLPTAITTNVGCHVADCPIDLNANCPDVLRLTSPNGTIVGCKSSCVVVEAEEKGGLASSLDCCVANSSSPDTCPPDGVQFYHYFKDACPNTYAYAFDESSGTALQSCDSDLSANYTLTFCPSPSLAVAQSASGSLSSTSQTSTSSSAVSTAPSSPSSGRHLKAGTIGGIAGGAIGLVLILTAFSSCILLKRRQKRRYREKDETIPNPFIEAPDHRPQPDFDPYSNVTSDSMISPNPYKGSTANPPEPSPVSPGHHDDEIVNQLRLGNLKLQQRVAILLGRNNRTSDSPHNPSLGQQEQETSERRQHQPVVHTDSGWRMERESSAEEMQDIPPTYTEV
ncbi:hypothetical protein D9758_017256 [Tetrapyrgos nigripes]|uniref:Uncharacterized protein n=1 Tax=Tetrapyrgos nigripes TaxID=182062 RepID=A0A8H5FG64_9AGAR|nr:hypothetical protein D9758_017256 [Tetrapyrgos nigripes]